MDKKDGNILEKKREETKFQNEITEMVNHAEKLAREYNFSLKKAVKKGVIDVECVYPSVIMIYEQVKQKINEKGWNDQLAIYDNQIRYYHELLDRDNKLRDLENQKFQEQKIFNDSQIYAKKAKEELLKLKTQALEVKKRSAMEYESKKDQAFNFMDLAKKELKQNNFEKAISYYIESEKIFAEIKWPEGIRMIKDSINVIKLKKERIEREAKLTELKTREKLKLEAQIPFMIIRSNHLQDLQQEHRRRELLRIEEEKEREREISEKAFSYLEEGTALKNKKKFEEAYEKYILGRDMFKKIGWEHEASRINNDLLIMLKKEMNQASRLKFYQQRIIQEKLELEELLRDADENQKELDKRRKLEKRKQREKLIQKELDSVNDIVKMLKYNEAVLGLRKIIKKIENTNLDNLKKDINDQIEVLLNASQVPIITNFDLERDENLNSFKLAYQALDKAQISLLNNAFFRAITELNEALFNLKETKIGIRFISAIEGKIITYKKELDIKETPEQKINAPKI